MIPVFNSISICTQRMGERIAYYLQVSGGVLKKGHEGEDYVPSNLADKRIKSLPIPGLCTSDIDIPANGRAYGINNVIWYKGISEKWQYCHQSFNNLSVGQIVPPSSYIGLMGATGNASGEHVHINRFKVDSNGNILNYSNGFLGGVAASEILNLNSLGGADVTKYEFLLKLSRGLVPQWTEAQHEKWAHDKDAAEVDITNLIKDDILPIKWQEARADLLTSIQQLTRDRDTEAGLADERQKKIIELNTQITNYVEKLEQTKTNSNPGATQPASPEPQVPEGPKDQPPTPNSDDSDSSRPVWYRIVSDLFASAQRYFDRFNK